jgi:hypothetical protein
MIISVAFKQIPSTTNIAQRVAMVTSRLSCDLCHAMSPIAMYICKRSITLSNIEIVISLLRAGNAEIKLAAAAMKGVTVAFKTNS